MIKKLFIYSLLIIRIIGLGYIPNAHASAFTIPLKGRVFWLGLRSSIPAGWSEDTDFIDKYLQPVIGDPSGDGGGTHNHTQSHTHGSNSHYHLVTLDSVDLTPDPSDPEQPPFNLQRIAFGSNQAKNVHAHTQDASTSANISYNNNTDSTSFEVMIPSSVTTIVLKPDSEGEDIPFGALVFSDTSIFTDFIAISSSFKDKFLVGASAGDDGGDEINVSSHTHGALNHKHLEQSHFHTNSQVLGSAQSEGGANIGTTTKNKKSHHTVGLDNELMDNVQNADMDITANTSNEPAYYTLLGMHNIGSPATPQGIIIPWVGTQAEINTAGWELFSVITSSQIRVTDTPGDIGNEGGNNMHTHPGASHTHTENAHNHTTTQTFDAGATATRSGTFAHWASTHDHPATVTTTAPTLQNASTTTDEADGRAAYKEILLIKRVNQSGGGKIYIFGSLGVAKFDIEEEV